jgi:hypothetical protein
MFWEADANDTKSSLTYLLHIFADDIQFAVYLLTHQHPLVLCAFLYGIDGKQYIKSLLQTQAWIRTIHS